MPHDWSMSGHKSDEPTDPKTCCVLRVPRLNGNFCVCVVAFCCRAFRLLWGGEAPHV